MASIGTTKLNNEAACPIDLKDIEWKRYTEIEGLEDAEIFTDGIDSGAPCQGNLGNCYLPAFLSSLAEWPDRITPLIDVDKCVHGKWVVNVYMDGIPSQIVVDTFVPVSKESGKPCFSKSRRKELWVIILEKAWAKMHGCYIKTSLGFKVKEPLMTFCAVNNLELTYDDTKIRDWLSFEKKDYVMHTAIHSGAPGE